MPVNLTKRLLAVGTRLPFVPLVDDVPYHAAFRVGLDLGEAILSATRPLWPTRALVQTDVGYAQYSLPSYLRHIDVNSSGLLGLRAGDNALSVIAVSSRAIRNNPKETITARKSRTTTSIK